MTNKTAVDWKVNEKAVEQKVNEMIAGTREIPASLRPLVEAHRKIDEYLVDPQKLVAELNRALVAIIKAAEAAKIEIPVSVMLTAEDVPACVRATVASHARLQAYYVDPIKLEADCNQLFDAMVAAINMMDAFASLKPILTAAAAAPQIHVVRTPGIPVRRAV